MSSSPRLSALVVIRNEEERLPACLERLTFADELVVVLDRCTDRSKEIALSFQAKIVEGAWESEGERRNAGLDACSGDWVLEMDADEQVTPELATEIRHVVNTSTYDRHDIPLDNYIGEHRVRYGWGCNFGTSLVPRLNRRGAKRWGPERVHPSLILSGQKGPALTQRFDHYVDRNISDMLRRLDAYSSARARDLREKGETWGSLGSNIRRFFTRFYKCYVTRRGWKEKDYGVLIALMAGMYPLLSHLKAKYEKD